MVSLQYKNSFNIISCLWKQFTGDPWIPLQKSRNVNPCVLFVLSMNKLLDKQSSCDHWVDKS